MRFSTISVILLLASALIPVQSGTTPQINLQLGNTIITQDGQSLIEIGGECGGGKVLAFHLPQKGWFVCSTEPYVGYDFQKIGKLNGNRISFNLDNVEYQITSDRPINSGSQMLDLWIVRITPPADKADANNKLISCSSDFKYWLESVLLREEKK